MFRKIVPVTLALYILVLGALGCTSTAQTATNAPRPGQPTNAPAAASGQKMYACSLFSPTEANALVGKPVTSVPWQPAPGTESIAATCIYQAQSAPDARAQLDVWRYPGGKEAHQGFEEYKTMMGAMLSAKPEMVTGLGDEAFWIGVPPNRQLYVRADIFLLSIKPTFQVQDAKVEQLVKQMLGHVRDVFQAPPSIETSTQQQPTSAPATSTPATKVAAPTATAVSGGGTSTSFDGQWQGKISNKTRFAFTVAKNEINRVNLDFEVIAGVCKGFGGTLILNVKDAPVRDNKFTAQVQDKDSKLEIKGTLQSPTQASGTLHLTGKSSFCGDYELVAEWTASK